MRLKIIVRVKFPACPSSIFSFGGEGTKMADLCVCLPVGGVNGFPCSFSESDSR